jgi:hypothetical protein
MIRTVTLALSIVAMCSVSVRGGESWQDAPNPYDKGSYDYDGGYTGAPADNTWGRSWDKRTPLVEHPKALRASKPAAPKEKKPAPKSEPQKKDAKK